MSPWPRDVATRGDALTLLRSLLDDCAAAALLTTLAKLLFHHANGENDTPSGIMHAVDRDFRSILGARSLMTAMCVALDVKRGAGTIVGAGHPPLLIARGDGATESIASTSPRRE